jgi:hypothetical protein
MPQCIFCKSESNRFRTREHVLPESLGGGEWALLNDGLLCDACQNRFGSDVEQKALGDYPFSFFRVFMGVPTKKRKAPWFTSWEGDLHAGDAPGTLGYVPAPIFLNATKRREKTVMRIAAEPKRPKMVCRMLLKMAIEVIANDNSLDVFHERYDSARRFALTGRKKGDWWYLLREDMDAATKFITHGASIGEWSSRVSLSVSDIEDGAEMFHLRLLYLDLMAPIDPRIQPPSIEDLGQPEYRVFVI